ncbi:MJ0042-type zinc finger domain-containing protein [Hornefia butyriciproducens]
MNVEEQKNVVAGKKVRCSKCHHKFASWFFPIHISFCYGIDA